MLVFRNKGLIPEAAIMTMGVNAKINDNPIGQFGTGLKYAIAIILRLGGKITIYRGLKKMEFGLKKETIRKQDFNIVTMNGRKLGFTDQLGLNWKPWMAYRELASNVRDEGGWVKHYMRADEPGPARNETSIHVDCPELDKTHVERHTLFLNTEPVFTLPGLEVHSGTDNQHIFYRGIRVMELPKKSKYSYNITRHVELTEDRTVLYPWWIPIEVARSITQSPNRSFLLSVLDADEVKDLWEQTLPYDNGNVKDHAKPTDQFMDLCEHLKSEKRLLSHASSFYNHWADRSPGRASPYNVTLTEQQELVVHNALVRLNNIGVKLNRGNLVFKSQLSLGKVQVAGRTTLVVESKFLDSESKLARVLLEGVALMQGGSAVEQLTNYVLNRSWIPPELTEGYDERAVDLEVAY